MVSSGTAQEPIVREDVRSNTPINDISCKVHLIKMFGAAFGKGHAHSPKGDIDQSSSAKYLHSGLVGALTRSKKNLSAMRQKVRTAIARKRQLQFSHGRRCFHLR